MLKYLPLLLLAACGTAPAGGNANAAAPLATATPATAPAPVTAAPPVPPRPALAIEGEGLRLVDPQSGRATPVAFGTPEARTLAAVTTSLGKPDAQGSNADCPTGPVRFARWNKALTLHFRDGAFVGWVGDARTKTMSGIGIGSTRKQLFDVYDAQVEQTGLGTRFTAGALTGVLDSDAPRAAITDLWAGEACVAS